MVVIVMVIAMSMLVMMMRVTLILDAANHDIELHGADVRPDHP
jgi:hypothetical protein